MDGGNDNPDAVTVPFFEVNLTRLGPRLALARYVCRAACVYNSYVRVARTRGKYSEVVY